MNKIFLLPLILLVFIINLLSCSGKADDDIIPVDEFASIVEDLHIADAIIAEKGFSGISFIDSMPSYYVEILKKHQISKTRFDNSLRYYSQDMETMILIYDKVIASINRRMPKKLNDKSIFRISDLALNEATIQTNPEKWFSSSGMVIWSGKRNFTIIKKDTTKITINAKLKYRCLLMLQASMSIYKDDSTKNQRMMIKVKYKDSTYSTAEKKLTQNKGEWTNYQLFLKTDSLKKMDSVICYVVQYDSIIGNRHVSVKDAVLKQYAINKDTSQLIIKEEKKQKIAIPPKTIKKRINKKLPKLTEIKN